MKVTGQIVKWFFSLSMHLAALGTIAAFFYPVASWYLTSRPLFGVDFFNTVSLTTILQKNLVLPPAAWLANWFGGWPFISQYPVLHFYAILPFSFLFSVVTATQVWMIVVTSLYFAGIYVFLEAISGNKILAAILAIGAIYSVGVYGALLWGGSLPFYATQAFFPWTLWMLVRFFKSGNLRYLLWAALTTGVAMYGHPQIVLTYIYPGATLLLLFGSGVKIRFLNIRKKILYLLLFGSLSFVIGLPMVYQTMGQGLSRLVIVGGREQALSTVRLDAAAKSDLNAFQRMQPMKIFYDTNIIFFTSLAITGLLAILGFLLKPRRQIISELLPYIALAAYFIFYITIYAFDISFYHGGWYRLFWSVPVWLGALSAIFWKQLTIGIENSFLRRAKTVLILPLSIAVPIIIIICSMWLPESNKLGSGTPTYLQLTEKFNTRNIQDPTALRFAQSVPYPDIKKFILRISDEGKATFSSAYPMGVNIYPISKELASALVPEYMRTSDSKKYRLYSADATFNIGWSAYSALSLARGYIDPPISDVERGYLFWLDAAVNVDPKDGGPGLVVGFGYPEEVARNHAWFLIDWNGIGYFQGGSWSAYSSPINSLVNTPEGILENTDVDISPEFPVAEQHQGLKYLRVNPEMTSPILHGTDAPVVGIYASDSGFETVVRSLAAVNLNSKYIIPVKLDKKLNNYRLTDLEKFDAVILYDYDYTNRNAFAKITEYAKKGGRVFIDSGVETKEADNRHLELPEIFPFQSLSRLGLGTEWDLQIAEDKLMDGVDITAFAPPLFDKTEWKFAYPVDTTPRENNQVIVTNHQKPVVTIGTIGEGKVLWSGMNIFYHVSRYNNFEEGKFFKNLLTLLLPLDAKKPIEGTADSTDPRHVTFASSGGKGVLFRGQLYPGWSARIKTATATESIPIYKVGPTYPGFMYVRIPNETKDYTLEFTYRGAIQAWLMMIVSFVVMMFLVDEIFLRGLILGKLVRKILSISKARTGKWWEKEDEE